MVLENLDPEPELSVSKVRGNQSSVLLLKVLRLTCQMRIVVVTANMKGKCTFRGISWYIEEKEGKKGESVDPEKKTNWAWEIV